MNTRIITAAATLLAGFAALPTSAEDAATQPAGAALTVTVKSITGAAYRLDTTAAKPRWVRLSLDEKLGEGAIVRTGFGSEATLVFADNSVVILEAATKIGITEFRREDGLTKTYLLGKYGAVRATIHKDKGPNDFRIVTPVATCAAIGTGGRINLNALNSPVFGPNRAVLSGFSGTWLIYRTGNTWRYKSVRKGEVSDGVLNSIALKKIQRDLRMIASGPGLTPSERTLLDLFGEGRNHFVLTGRKSLGGSLTPQPQQNRIILTGGQ